jgi:hypothetical protein
MQLNILQNQNTLDNILNLPSAIVSVITIIGYIIRTVKYIQTKRTATTKKLPGQQIIEPGYYRRRITIILTEILLLPILAFLALFYSEQKDFLGLLIFYSSLILLLYIMLTIPLSIFATVKKW